MNKKIKIIFVFAILLILIVVIQLYRTIFYNRVETYKYVYDKQSKKSQEIPYKRGVIYDRNNVVLARSEVNYDVVVDPKMIFEYSDINKVVDILSSSLKISSKELLEKINGNKNKSYLIVTKNIDEDLKNKIESSIAKINRDINEKQNISKNVNYVKKIRNKLFNKKQAKEEKKEVNNVDVKILGVFFEKKYNRRYPKNNLACDIVGFVNYNENGEIGIEKQYNEYLIGKNGVAYTYINENKEIEKEYIAPVNGGNIVSTIDSGIQSIVEEEILKVNRDIGAKKIASIVMDPNNGEILAMASTPFFDLNKPSEKYDYNLRDDNPIKKDKEKKEAVKKSKEELESEKLNELWRNFCVSDDFEPGSTFKPFTVAEALELSKVTGNETYICNGYEEISGVKIYCHKRNGHGSIKFSHALAESCNVVMMKIAQKIGKTNFEYYTKYFGFGKKTGIDLPNETSGNIFKESQLNPVELATSSFGQSQTVSMLQIISGFSSLVNGGNYYRPHVVKEITTQTGEVIKIEPELLFKSVSSDTSKKIKRYLEETLLTGTARSARISGLRWGGKTGTAEKLPRKEKNYIISFIGAVPIDNPKFVIYTVVDEANSRDQTENKIPVLLTRNIVYRISSYFDIYLDEEKDVTHNVRKRIEEVTGYIFASKTKDVNYSEEEKEFYNKKAKKIKELKNKDIENLTP